MFSDSKIVGPEIIGIGIDVGMTYSGAAISYRAFNGYNILNVIPTREGAGEAKFPSQVFIHTATGSAIVGGQIDEKPGKLYTLFKRELGTVWSDSTTGRTVTATSLTAEIIKEIKSNIDSHLRDQHLTQAPIIRYAFSYPGIWKEPQLRELGQAIKEAGIMEYVVIEEPLAAALGGAKAVNDLNIFTTGSYTFVCDLGGGTLDLAVIMVNPDGSIQAKAAVQGHAKLGMSNIDKLLGLLLYRQAGYAITPKMKQVLDGPICVGKELEQAWQEIDFSDAGKSKLLYIAEELKKEITRHWGRLTDFPAALPDPDNAASTHLLKVSSNEVAPIFTSMVQEVKRSVSNYLSELESTFGITEQHFSYLLITGGGSNLPGIGEELNNLLPSTQRLRIASDTAMRLVQQGAALFARNPAFIKERRCNSSFGVKTFVRIQPNYEGEIKTEVVEKDGQKVTYYAYYDRFLKRGAPIPKEGVTHDFTPLQPNQKAVSFPILQGEDNNPSLNQVIGTLPLNLPDGASDNYIVHCIFYLGPDGLIHVYAWDPAKPNEPTEEIKFTWQLGPDDD